MTGRTLYIIDGSSCLFRAYHALPPLSTRDGVPTGAVYGFATMLMKTIREKRPDELVVAFDPPGPTDRHERFAEYKANRPQMPDDLARQVPYVHRLLEAMRVPVVMQDAREADDLIGSLAKQAAAKGRHVVVVTGDKDMLQLVGPRVQVYDSMKEKLYGEEDVVKRFGVPPQQVVEVMGLMGDAIDNIPGVRGIGEKTATSLIRQFGTIERALDRLSEIRSTRVRDLLSAHAEQARLSRELAQIKTDLPVPVELEELAAQRPDEQALQALFRELEFTGLQRDVPASAIPTPVRIVTPDRPEAVARIVEDLLDTDEVAISVGVLESGPSGARRAGVALCREPGVAVCFFPGSPIADDAFPRLRAVLGGTRPAKVGHDLKRAVAVLRREGVSVAGLGFDTMVAAYLLNPGRADHSLETVAFDQLGVRPAPERAVEAGDAGPHGALRRAAEEAVLARELKRVLQPRLQSLELTGLFESIEMPLIEVLAAMEMAGFKIDADQLRELGKELEAQLGQLETRIFALAGGRFNINSPKQLSDVLFQRLQLKPVKRTKTGFSTDMDVLQQLAGSHELPAEVLSYRSLAKLKSTYVDVLPQLADPRTGRVHTSFNQTVAATGRLTSSEPNLQNIPIRTELGRRIRRAFVAANDHLLLSADYSQVELRILAHLSGDEALIAAFRAGIDIHGATAAGLFGVAHGAVTPEMRRRAKAVNFGIIYGMSPFGLASDLGISQDEAALYIDRYFQVHQGVKAFIDRVVQDARERGVVTTLWGRRRPVPELRSSSQAVRQLGERLAVNSPIQGSAADLIKIAMIAIFRRLEREGLGTAMILQIHDELLFEVPEAELEAAKRLVADEMERAATLGVPLKVDLGVGPNWAEAHGH
jgi:DNA polymerase-1